jgi:hypothetical protein
MSNSQLPTIGDGSAGKTFARSILSAQVRHLPRTINLMKSCGLNPNNTTFDRPKKYAMRFLKLAIISFIILFLVVSMIGLMFPSTVSVSRAVEVGAPRDTIYQYLNDIKYWKLWMAGADTNTITFESAKTAGPGAVARIGTGEVTMTRTAPDSIYMVWKSEKGHVQASGFTIMSHLKDSGFTVQWYFQQKLNWYPWERFASLANDKILGPIMEESLNKLQKILTTKK